MVATAAVTEVTIIFHVVVRARPAVLRVLVIRHRLGADVNDMLNVGDLEGMLPSVDGAGTFVGRVRVARVAHRQRPGVAELRVPPRFRACRNPA